MRPRLALLVVPFLLFSLIPAVAQDYPRHGTPKETISAPTQPTGPPLPRIALVFKLGGVFPSGDSDLWDFNADLFTADAEDFDDAAFGFELLLLTANHLDLSFALEVYEGSASSVYRDYVDSFGQPIGQYQSLDLLPMTVSLRWMPFGRYGPGGAPRRVVPYLSVGGGGVFWEYELTGSFVDPGTLGIYDDYFYSDGAALAGVAAAGLEVPLSRAWSVHLEGRYLWAQDDLDEDFAGFDEFDLGGWAAFIGAGVRF